MADLDAAQVFSYDSANILEGQLMMKYINDGLALNALYLIITFSGPTINNEDPTIINMQSCFSDKNDPYPLPIMVTHTILRGEELPPNTLQLEIQLNNTELSHPVNILGTPATYYDKICTYLSTLDAEPLQRPQPPSPYCTILRF